jgi:hypothetical protein
MVHEFVVYYSEKHVPYSLLVGSSVSVERLGPQSEQFSGSNYVSLYRFYST